MPYELCSDKNVSVIILIKNATSVNLARLWQAIRVFLTKCFKVNTSQTYNLRTCDNVTLLFINKHRGICNSSTFRMRLKLFIPSKCLHSAKIMWAKKQAIM